MVRHRPQWRSAFWPGLLLALLLALAPAVCRAQVVPGAAAHLDDWDRLLAAARQALVASTLPPERAATEQDAMRSVLDESRVLEARLLAGRAMVQAELDVLGPAPPAADVLTPLRQQAQATAAQIDMQLRRARLDRLTAQELLTGIGLRRQQAMRKEIMRRTPTPLAAATWRAAGAEARAVWARLRAELTQPAPPLSAVHVLLLCLILLMLAGAALRHAVQRRAAPTTRARFVAVLAEAVPALLTTIIGILFVRARLDRELSGGATLDALLIGIEKAVLGALVLLALARAAIGANRPGWGLLGLEPADARLLWHRAAVFAWVFAAPAVLLTIADDGLLHDPSLFSVLALLDSLLKLGAACLLLAPALWRPFIASLGPRRTLLVRGLCLLAFVVPVPLAMVGHAELAEQWLMRLLVALALSGAALLARAALIGLMAPAAAPAPVTGMAEDIAAPRGAPVLLLLALDAAVLLVLLYLFLLLVNVSPGLMRAWAVLLYEGIPIGAGHVVSLRALFQAAIVVVLVLLAARLVERVVTGGVLRRTRLDSGVRDAIGIGLRYFGIVVAVAIGISMLGISLTSLALVASALSVGAGFGLRQLVENVIAGLLLLIERPIRAGDWIVVDGQEGIVRRISARATQVETFDRATVIVPNARMTGGAVTNWTHADRVARVVVAVSAPAGSPADVVRRILVDAALAHPRVLAAPPPVALFVHFGHKHMGFELRCFIADTTWFATVKSDLHYAIDAAFHKAGILRPRYSGPLPEPSPLPATEALSDAG